MLDTNEKNRDTNKNENDDENYEESVIDKKMSYLFNIIDYDKNKTILGKEQWQWLRNELRKKYDLFILLSFISLSPFLVFHNLLLV